MTSCFEFINEYAIEYYNHRTLSSSAQKYIVTYKIVLIQQVSTHQCNDAIRRIIFYVKNKPTTEHNMSQKLRLVRVNLKFSTLKGKQIGPFRTFKLFPRTRSSVPSRRYVRGESFFQIGRYLNGEHIPRVSIYTRISFSINSAAISSSRSVFPFSTSHMSPRIISTTVPI